MGRYLDPNEIAEDCDLLVSQSVEKKEEFIADLATFRTRTGNFTFSFTWIGIGTDK